MNFIINITENSKDGWYSAYKKWCQFDSSSCERCVINVALPERADTLTHTEVTDLRYFFPLLDKVHNDYKNVAVQLNVFIIEGEEYDRLNTPAKNSEKSKDSEIIDWESKISISDDSVRMRLRVEAFFQYFIAILNPPSSFIPRKPFSTSIYINKSPLKHPKLGRSRISPIFEVRDGKDSSLTIADLEQSYYDVGTKKNRISSTNQSIFIPCLILNSLLEALVDSKNYIGTKDFHISEERKFELCDELQVLFDTNLPQINYIAQMIWLYFLQNILENKELLTFDPIKGIANLRVDLIEKSLFDSIAYAEGILQLLENSCLYSEGKCAWFGFRIHRAGRNRPMSEFLTESKTRQFLYEKYADCYRKNGNIIPQHIFNEDYRYFIEFFVLDRAFLGTGIRKHYNESVAIYNQDNPSKTPKKKLTDDDDIFNLLPRNPLDSDSKDDAISCFVEDVTIHYGLKWFYRIALRNNGCFILNSPSMKSYYRSVKGGEPPSTHNASASDAPANDVPPVYIETKVEYCTEYTILLPVSYKWEETRDEFKSNPEQQPSYSDLSDYRSVLKFVYLSKAVDFVEKQKFITKLKSELFTSIFQRERSLTTKDVDRINRQIIVIEVPGGNKFDTECIAKALFGVLSYIYFSDISSIEDCRPRIAVNLTDISLLYEFIRIFAVFFDKAGTQRVLSNSQIALCITASKDYPPYVGLVLSGSNIYAAQETIRQYLYFNSTATANMLSVADYLTDVAISEKETQLSQDFSSQELIDTKHETISIFPFDLFLRNRNDVEAYEKRDIVPTSPTIESWFLNQAKSWVLKDYQKSPYGCKISDIHIRVGSKVYLDKFYVAELLFHTPVITHHFAYLIALDLLDTLKSVNRSVTKTVLLGYESYSAVLVQQIKNILSSKGTDYQKSIYTAITLNTNYDENEIIFSSGNPFDKATKPLTLKSSKTKTKKKLEDRVAEYMLITIVPIGTTLSTVLKMHSIFEREVKSRTTVYSEREVKNGTTVYSKNYCIVLSADYKKNKDSIENYWSYDLDEAYMPYVSDDKQPKNTVFIIPDTPFNFDSTRVTNQEKICKITVRYFINVESNWEIPFKETLELDHSRALPLIEVDKASSNPICIFPQKDKTIGFFEYQDASNTKRLEKFYKKIYYSHIGRGENHFQFYFDFKKFLAEYNNVIKIEEWLLEVSQKIDSNAYNIIITPVNETISIFLKLVTDLIFQNKVRLLIIPADNSYRESIRVKYSYIAEECAALRKNNPNYRINVYYVNDSIINGHSIERGLYLINMLLPNVLEKMMYTKILLLVNRSSYDTISRYVDNAKDDLFAYIQLAVPSYNMRKGTCPSCDLKKKYELLRDRSSTIVLATEFNRLAQKHELRTEAEYELWMKDRVRNSRSDLSRMVFWIYVLEKSEYSSDISCAINKPSKEAYPFENLKTKVARAKELLLKCTPLYETNGKLKAIHGLRLNATEEDELVDFVIDFVNASKDFLRLRTMHNAYRRLIPLPRGDSSVEDLNNNTYEQMLELIAESQQEATSQWQLIINAEWIISYFKVLSRDYLARYYHCRTAIYRIMLITAEYLLLDDNQAIQMRDQLNKSKEKNLIKILDSIRKPPTTLGKADEVPELCVGMQYEIFMTLIHRLADLQSEFVFHASTIQNTLKLYKKLSTKCDNQPEKKEIDIESFIYKYLPSIETVEIRYLKAIKTAVMATNNDALSFLLNNSWKTLNDSSKMGKSSSDALAIAGKTESEEENTLLNYKYLCLENSQYLYKGLSELSERNEDNEKCKELLQGAYKSSTKESTERLSDANLSYQNPFFFFCQMWHKTHDGRSPISEEKIYGISEWDKLSNLLDYYRTTKNLLKTDIPIDEVPYEFEKICNALSRFSNFDMCYIVTHLEGYLPQIVSLSGYLVEYLEEQAILEREDIEHFLAFVNKNDPKNPDHKFGLERVIDGIYNIPQYEFPAGTRTKQSKHEYQSLRVIKIGYADEPKKDIQYYVILQNAIEKSNEQHGLEMLECAQGILCLRESLSLIIKKYSDALLSLRYDCSYIKFYEKPDEDVSKKKSDDRAAKTPNILHISDLHITDDPDIDDESRENINRNIKAEIDKKAKGKRVDLLAITGDIVDCRVADAPIIQNNYRQAEKIILHIANCLWTDEKEKEGKIKPRLPHDWKRRIIVSPGNHDFAAMNQYRASLSKRALSAGVPSSGESGTMSKFTYFIEFMLHFLDAPVDEMIKNDLNDIRHYRNMDLSVLNLNALSVASPIRTNKVGINRYKLNELMTRKKWKEEACNFKICTTHYSPIYRPNYLLDAYDISLVQFSNLIPKRNRVMYKMFERKFREFSNSLLDMLLTLTTGEYQKKYIESEFYKNYFEVGFDQIWRSYIPLPDVDTKEDKFIKFKDSVFFKEISLFNRMLLEMPSEDDASANEQINRMLDFLKNTLSAQNLDAKIYRDLFGKIGSVNAILAGHVHKEDEKTFFAPEDIESPIFISGRTICGNSYKKDGSINCRLIELVDKRDKDIGEDS